MEAITTRKNGRESLATSLLQELTLAIMWLLCMPVGAILLLSYNMWRGAKTGDIQFEKNPGLWSLSCE